MEESAKFAKLDHLSSYSAAEVLGSDDLEKISYYPRKGWFVTRWQATVVAIAILLIVFSAVFISKSTDQNQKDSWSSEGDRTSRYSYHQNVSEAIHILPVLTPNNKENFRDRKPSNEDLLNYLIEPIHYSIKLKSIPTLHSIISKNAEFEGEVIIDLHSRENVDYMLIGVSELDGIKTTLQRKNMYQKTESYEIAITKIHQNQGLLRIEFAEPLVPSTLYELKISYRGIIRSLPYGLFYFLQQEEDLENLLIATNADVPYARTIFPCFDARNQNATYDISILRDGNMHFESSILHWEANSTKDEMIWQKTEVKKPMPSNHFQFTITSYHQQSVATPDLLHFSVWTPKERKAEVAYILDIGSKLIEDLQVYFDLPLPIPKVNIFALPQPVPYLKSKLGAIYVSESHVIYTPENCSEEHKQNVALSTAAHVAELWIESIITFCHENDEWLKDSLIEYMKYKALNFAEPQWRMDAQFYTNVQQIEMQNDITHNISEHSQINTSPDGLDNIPQYMFPVQKIQILGKTNRDTLTNYIKYEDMAAAGIYNRLHRSKSNSKGACILRMIQHMVTEPVFRISLTLFLEKSKNEDVLGNDFWSIMSTEVETAPQMEYKLLPENVSLNSVIKTWIENDGYPILTVTRDYDNGTITFSQNDLLAPYLGNGVKREQNYWYIPISYTTQKEEYFSATAPRLWLGKTFEKTIPKPTNLRDEQWLLVNLQHTGFYRVNYDETNWRMLNKSMQSDRFPAIIRSQLLDDALYLGRKGLLNYGLALDMTLTFGEFGEKDHTVWKPVLRHLQYIQNLLDHVEDIPGSGYETIIFKTFRKYVTWLIQPAFNYFILKQGVKGGNYHGKSLLRSEIFLWACAVNSEPCTRKMEEDFDSWKKITNSSERNPIEPDLRYAVLCSVMRQGRKDDFEFLLDRYSRTSATDPDKYNYLRSLFCYPHEDELQRLLTITLTSGYSEDLLSQVQQIWSALEDVFYATEIPFKYLMTYWEEIEEKYAEFHIIITTMLKSSATNIYTIASRDALKTFEDKHMNRLSYLEKIFLRATTAINDKITWKTSQLDKLGYWLKSNSPHFEDPRSPDKMVYTE